MRRNAVSPSVLPFFSVLRQGCPRQMREGAAAAASTAVARVTLAVSVKLAVLVTLAGWVTSAARVTLATGSSAAGTMAAFGMGPADVGTTAVGGPMAWARAGG